MHLHAILNLDLQLLSTFKYTLPPRSFNMAAIQASRQALRRTMLNTPRASAFARTYASASKTAVRTYSGNGKNIWPMRPQAD